MTCAFQVEGENSVPRTLRGGRGLHRVLLIEEMFAGEIAFRMGFHADRLNFSFFNVEEDELRPKSTCPLSYCKSIPSFPITISYI